MSTENILPECPTCKKDAGLCAKPGHSGHLPFGTWNKEQKGPDGSIVIDVDEHNRPITDNVLIKIMEQGYTRTEALKTCHTYGSILEGTSFNYSPALRRPEPEQEPLSTEEQLRRCQEKLHETRVDVRMLQEQLEAKEREQRDSVRASEAAPREYGRLEAAEKRAQEIMEMAQFSQSLRQHGKGKPRTDFIHDDTSSDGVVGGGKRRTKRRRSKKRKKRKSKRRKSKKKRRTKRC